MTPAERRHVARATYSLVVAAAMFVALAVCGVLYTGHAQREADRRWCELFETLDRPVPPTIKDPVQRQRSERAQQQFHKLRVDLGCVKE